MMIMTFVMISPPGGAIRAASLAASIAIRLNGFQVEIHDSRIVFKVLSGKEFEVVFLIKRECLATGVYREKTATRTRLYSKHSFNHFDDKPAQTFDYQNAKIIDTIQKKNVPL
jgi:hypothetical protein